MMAVASLALTLALIAFLIVVIIRKILREDAWLQERFGHHVPEAAAYEVCDECNDTGIVGWPPDGYFDCPYCAPPQTKKDTPND